MSDVTHYWMARAEEREAMTAFDYFSERAQQLPPPMVRQTAPTSKAPANRNDEEYNPSAADFMAGKIEWECRTAIRDLVSLYGENADRLVSDYLKDAKERKRS